ncbi:MAG: hypothetical protein AVDCRST_MAG60-654 [uncultured Nocardioides sp.]|uniref:Uncharacterized protein n=1 Tax=uncultured Nocardioides sp. TaxID=198441 RepID=A0A6J4N8F7_9ACTN|nr:MAG: hypothetical protein AVDCRST_MAG60-654 [uncultured Nocardioides sp.]
MSAPSASVLGAFDASGEPRPVEGGRGLAWRCGGVVLKPVDDAREHEWTCEAYDAWPVDAAVGVPRPLRTADGAWSHDGWAAPDLTRELWVFGEVS